MLINRRIRLWLWLVKAFFKKYTFYLVLLLVTLAILILGTKHLSKVINFNQPVYNEGIVGRYQISQIPARVTNLVTDSLFVFDEKGRVKKQLVEDFTVEDQTNYTLKIKENLYWQDGKPLNTSDIALDIEGVEIEFIDNKSIKFKLPESYSPFPSLLVKPVFKKDTLIGISDYQIASIQKEKDIVTKIVLDPMKNDLPKIVFKFFATDDQALTALKLGEVDAVSNLTNINELDNWPNLITLRSIDHQKIITVFFNTKLDLFSSKEVRQALNYAIDRSKFDLTKATSPINKNSWVFNKKVKEYKRDVEKTKQLLKDINLENNNITISYLPVYKDVAEQIKNDWQDYGLKVSMSEVKKVTDDFEVLIAGQEIPLDPDQYTLWHSTQKSNLTKYSNPKIDKLLEDGRKTFDEDQRFATYQDFQRVLVEESPAIFLFHPNKYFVYQKSKENLLTRIRENIDKQ